MKTRLLKRIRKRYAITKVDKLASDACHPHTAAKSVYGLPFYVLEDDEDKYGFFTKYFKTFEEARKKLCQWIIIDYGEKFRHKDEVSSRAWWVNKKKK